MEIKNKHLAALVTAKKELRASLGLYNPGDPCRVEVERHLTNLEELQSGLKALRRQQLGYNGAAAGDPVQQPQIAETQKIEDQEIFEELLKNATFITEHFVEFRKGVAQTFYVVKIEESDKYWNWREEQILPVPRWAVGYWRQRDAGDNRYMGVSECIADGDEWIPTIEQLGTGWE